MGLQSCYLCCLGQWYMLFRCGRRHIQRERLVSWSEAQVGARNGTRIKSGHQFLDRSRAIHRNRQMEIKVSDATEKKKKKRKERINTESIEAWQVTSASHAAGVRGSSTQATRGSGPFPAPRVVSRAWPLSQGDFASAGGPEIGCFALNAQSRVRGFIRKVCRLFNILFQWSRPLIRQCSDRFPSF